MISSLDRKQARKNIKVKISVLSKCPNQKAKNKKGGQMATLRQHLKNHRL